jgi:hypothetical protein
MTDSRNLRIDTNSLGPVRLNRKKHIAPCERRVLELLDELRGVRENNPKGYYPRLAEAAKKDYWIYLRLILNYNFLDPWDHGEEVVPFIQDCVDNNEPGLIMAPRGAAKTGVATVPITPWLLARNPNITTIITNVREEKASYFARLASKIITESANYRTCYPYVVPTDKWGEGGYYLKSQKGIIGRVDPSIGSFGVGGNIVGAHVSAIIHDDLINDKTYLSPAEREKAKAFLIESLNCLDPGGTFLTMCTRWHFDDVYGKLERGEILIDGKKPKVFKRAAERYVLNDQNEPVVEVFNARRTYIDMAGNRMTVGFTAEELAGKKLSLGALYSALYENEPVSDADRVLQVENVNQYISFNQGLAPLGKIGVEIVSTAETFWQALINEMREKNIGYAVQKIRPRPSSRGIEKHARIRAVVGQVVSNGKLYVRDDVWARDNNLGQEMREFDRGADDLLDALTYAILNAPKWVAGQPSIPYLAVDPAFTANTTSDSTAIIVGCWVRDDFYVLDSHKFKAQKTEIILGQIFKMAEKYREGSEARDANRPLPSRGFVSTGNEHKSHQAAGQAFWGVSKNIDSEGDDDEKRQKYGNRRSVKVYRGFRH